MSAPAKATRAISESWGNGVYKSTDGGKTWTHCGLADTHHIGRIVVHPKNPDVAYVAALGHFWGPNTERGLYKTTDGGKTWKNVKFIDADTGFIDVQMDPEEPDTLYAAAWQVRRDGFSGGNPKTQTGTGGRPLQDHRRRQDLGEDGRRPARDRRLRPLRDRRSTGRTRRSSTPSCRPSETAGLRRTSASRNAGGKDGKPGKVGTARDRRHLPLGRQGQDVDEDQRPRAAAVLLRPDPRRPHRRQEHLRARRLVPRRRPTAARPSRPTGQQHPLGPPRPVDQPEGPESPHPRQRRRAVRLEGPRRRRSTPSAAS